MKKSDDEETHNLDRFQILEGLECAFSTFLPGQMHSLVSPVTNIRSFSPSRDTVHCDAHRDCDESRSHLLHRERDFDAANLLDSSSYFNAQIISQEFLNEYHQEIHSTRRALEVEKIAEVSLNTSCDGAEDPDEANLFDFLVELVGDLPAEGDPFTPEPLTE